MQKIIFTGNLGNDPEMRYTPNGQGVTNFRVASNRTYTGADGEKVKETIWIRVTAWGKLAEICNEYLKKGRKVLVEGRLVPDKKGNPRIWTDRDGGAQASFEVTATEVEFLGSPNGNGNGDSEHRDVEDDDEDGAPW